MSTKLIKLITGEELICSMEENDIGLVIKKPIQVIMQFDRQSQNIGMALAPYAPCADKTEGLQVIAGTVVWIAEPDEELRNQYAQATGGVVLAKADEATANKLKIVTD